MRELSLARSVGRGWTASTAAVLSDLSRDGPLDRPALPGRPWTVRRSWLTSAGTTAIVLRPGPSTASLSTPDTVHAAAPGLIVRLAGTPDGAQALRRHAAAVRALAADPRLAGWAHRLPRIVAAGEVRGRTYLIESALPGRPADLIFADPTRRSALLAAAVRVAADLHARTGQVVTIGAAELTRWVERPVEEVFRLLPTARVGRVGRTLRGLADELHGHLAGRRLRVGWVHGDLWLGNVLVGDGDGDGDGDGHGHGAGNGDGGAVTGLVDWDQAEQGEPGLQDVVHLLLYTRRIAEGRELGRVIGELLARRCWWPAEQRLIEQSVPADGALPVRVAVALSWLRHVARTGRQPNHASNLLWRRRNVVAVVQAMHASGGQAG
jgi:hypothetical protein